MYDKEAEYVMDVLYPEYKCGLDVVQARIIIYNSSNFNKY